MNLNFETDGLDFNSKGKPDEIATPIHICRDMSNLFDYTNCNQKIWMDIFCKTGNTLEALKENGVSKNNIAAVCNNKQSQMLACRKLYGELLPEIEVEIIVKSLEAYKITRRGQVYWVSNWQYIVKNNYQDAYNIIKFVILKEMEKTMQLEWNSDKEFQINNIIMNPPYNNDMYIDFVTLAKNIATDGVVPITPAKGINGKGGKKNEDFRGNIVPYISEIIYYPNCKDVFDITESGIAYYLIDTGSEHKTKRIENRCIKAPEYNDEQCRVISNTLINKAESILNKVVSGTKNSLNINTSRTYFVNAKQSYGGNKDDYDYLVIGGSSSGDKTIHGYAKQEYISNVNDASRHKAVMSFKVSSNCVLDSRGHVSVINPIKYLNTNEICKDDFIVLRVADSKEEIESFISYINCSLIKYLLWVANIGANASNKEFWRFVPDPGVFDHIFTDAELYQKYGLTPDEIAIIESVIKERK